MCDTLAQGPSSKKKKKSRFLQIFSLAAHSTTELISSTSSNLPGRNVVFNKTIAGRRRTLLLKIKSPSLRQMKIKVPSLHVHVKILVPVQAAPGKKAEPRKTSRGQSHTRKNCVFATLGE